MVDSVLSGNMRLTVLLVLLTVAYAGRAPYLGGDIQDILEETKESKIIRPGIGKHVTEKQRRDSNTYNSKFTDIAKAYAEGYKAAIKAVQARAYIAKRRLLSSKYGSISAKSSIPYRNYENKPVLQNTLPLASKSMIATNGKLSNPANRIANNQFNLRNQRVTKSTIPTDSYNIFANLEPQNKAVSNPLLQEKMIARNNIPLTVSGNADTSFEGVSQPSRANSMLNDNGNSKIASRSNIPEPHQVIRYPMHQKSDIFNPIENSYFRHFPSFFSPISNEMKVSPVDSSLVPPASFSSDVPHSIVTRSVGISKYEGKQPYHPAFSSVPLELRSEIEINRIAKLNSRGRHRNVYFDGTGGNPFNGGGVLSHQNAISLKKHRRRRRRSIKETTYSPNKKFLARHRRSHMPYLGQNLDKLGVVRAIPKTWTAEKKSIEAKIPDIPGQDAAYADLSSYPQFVGNPGKFTQFMPGTFRGIIPQSMGMSPGSMEGNYRQMYHYPLLQQYSGFRSMIPSYPAFYNQIPTPFGYSYHAPVPRGLIPGSSPAVENEDSNIIERVKKSGIAKPDRFRT